jgi:succinate dehydrogenase / fumarate reductase flavoprotein subunit
MQGLADGYFILPYTVGDWLARAGKSPVTPTHAEAVRTLDEVTASVKRLLAVRGRRTSSTFHRDLGRLLWNRCGMGRNDSGLKEALGAIPEIRAEFWQDVNVLGENDSFNVALERAGRVADFLEFAELMCHDALERRESCGGHFREEHQTPDGEAMRDDAQFSHVSAWEYAGPGSPPVMHKEPLVFEHVQPSQRSYK